VSSVSVPLRTTAVTEALAAKIARGLPAELAGWKLLLQGELGAGKSTFARAMLHAMGFEGLVPSPTYTLVEPYNIEGNIIYHIDLYRIASMDELQFLGWADMQDGLMMIEWPERVPGLANDADAIIELRYEGDGRDALVTATSERAQASVLPSAESFDSDDY
jgi:tRNA threonylcarbamoyladenosine biosynthesis protein TsaE